MKLQNGFSCTMHCATKDYKLTSLIDLKNEKSFKIYKFKILS